MAIIPSSNQYKFTGKGPIDSKTLVKTYANLFTESTWQENGANIAYNGMIVAVWLNKDDTTKNGIYFLFDPECTSTLKNPDVTNEANWHKLVDAEGLVDKLSLIDERLTALEEKESDVVTYGYRSGFPVTGEVNKLYVAVDEGKSYVWFDNDYLPVSGGGDYTEPEVIYGGDSGVNN